jgi:hypothetical protein
MVYSRSVRLALSVPFMIARKSLSMPQIMFVMLLNTMLILFGARCARRALKRAHTAART